MKNDIGINNSPHENGAIFVRGWELKRVLGYIKKIILTYIDEKAKLNLVKYNKKLQEGLNLNLFYYKYIVKNILP